MKNQILFLLLIAYIATFTSCKKDESSESDLTLTVHYEVDGKTLAFDSILYTNAAGNHYSVSRLQYYLSSISLILPDLSLYLLKDYHFFDVKISSTNSFVINKLPKGNYIGIRFNFGLDSIQNKSNALPSTNENLSMIWPDAMGGGYHFMKMEGYYEDGTSTPGYTMHIGMNDCMFESTIYSTINITNDTHSLNMVMNINEWYQHPQNFDFNIDGNYTMGSMPLMMKLVNNGKDIFSIK